MHGGKPVPAGLMSDFSSRVRFPKLIFLFEGIGMIFGNLNESNKSNAICVLVFGFFL